MSLNVLCELSFWIHIKHIKQSFCSSEAKKRTNSETHQTKRVLHCAVSLTVTKYTKAEHAVGMLKATLKTLSNVSSVDHSHWKSHNEQMYNKMNPKLTKYN